MEEDSDILASARQLITRFGADALGSGEARAEAHRRAEESDGAEFWQRVADAVRTILTGHRPS